MGLDGRLHHYPHQLAANNSGSPSARALANRPKLVLAYLLMGNLDARNSQQALKLIEVCAENGAALLLVSHERDAPQFEMVRSLAEINQADAQVEVCG